MADPKEMAERLRDLADEGELIHLYPHDLLCRRFREAATLIERLTVADLSRWYGFARARPNMTNEEVAQDLIDHLTTGTEVQG